MLRIYPSHDLVRRTCRHVKRSSVVCAVTLAALLSLLQPKHALAMHDKLTSKFMYICSPSCALFLKQLYAVLSEQLTTSPDHLDLWDFSIAERRVCMYLLNIYDLCGV